MSLDVVHNSKIFQSQNSKVKVSKLKFQGQDFKVKISRSKIFEDLKIGNI